ncbi:hypothetical protein D9M70_493810 [compost metagenome]
MLDGFRAKTGVWPGQQHVEHHAEQGRVALGQGLFQFLAQSLRQIAVGIGLVRVHGNFTKLLVIGRQDIATDIPQFEEHRERQDAAQHTFWAESRCLDRAHRDLGALGRLVRRAQALGVDVLEYAVIAHERHGGRGHAAGTARPVAVFDHPAR